MKKPVGTKQEFIKFFNHMNKMCDDAYRHIKRQPHILVPEVAGIAKDLDKELIQVLRLGAQESDSPAHSPLLKVWIGDKKELSGDPLPGEEELLNHVFSYLCDYYNVNTDKFNLEELRRLASDDPNNILANEAYYEIHQVFSAIGRSSSKDMNLQRREKLDLYAMDHKFKPDFDVMYEAFLIHVEEQQVHATLIPVVKKGSLADNPFQGRGPRNVGTPFWLKTSTKLESIKHKYSNVPNFESIEDGVYNLANMVKNSKPKDLISIPATMFGRNQTKGYDYEINHGKIRVKEFKSSPRVIYGVSLTLNTLIARMYNSVLMESKMKMFLYPLRGTNALRSMLPELAALDKRLGVYRISFDGSKYDTTISRGVMIVQALADICSFGYNGNMVEIVILSLFTDAFNPIYYLNTEKDPKGKVDVLGTDGAHKSGFYNTLLGGSAFGRLLYKYAFLKLAKDPKFAWVRKWFFDHLRIYHNSKLPFYMTIGDDGSVPAPNREVAQKIIDIIIDDFGMNSNFDKAAGGTGIVQMGCNSKGGVSYPLARAIRAIYYPERDPGGKPPYVQLMTAYSMIELLGESPHLNYYIKEHVLKADKFKGGLLSMNLKEQSFQQFYEVFVMQAQDYAKGKMFDESDPRGVDILDKDGKPKSDGLQKIGNKIKSLN